MYLTAIEEIKDLPKQVLKVLNVLLLFHSLNHMSVPIVTISKFHKQTASHGRRFQTTAQVVFILKTKQNKNHIVFELESEIKMVTFYVTLQP